MFTITTVFKNIVIHLRMWIKLIILLLIGFAIVGFIIFVVYKPMYTVILDGEFIGYTEDKSELQNKINEYIKNGDSGTVAFVEIDSLPEYSLCLIKKGLTANDNEIFSKVISSGIPYYKYYAVIENSQEKYYIESYEESEAIIQQLKEKNSKNKNDITYLLKYETEIKEFTNVETAVASLYVEVPRTVTGNKKINTAKTVDYSNTSLGIALIKPISGTITSRFGTRSRGTHTGLDIAASSGTSIKAAANGTVEFAGYKGSYGNLVVISHGNGIETYYGHCSKIYVSAGSSVNQGDVISAVGSTGNSTGPHLHLEVRVNGVAKNPQNYVY